VIDASTVHYTVTFSEPVVGVTADQFSLVTTGHVNGASITSVTPVDGSNGASYVVTVDSGTGSGTVALQLTGSHVHDAGGNGLGPLQSEADYATGGLAGAIAIGDINGDGKPDLIVTGVAQ
jgi:hypothetical protein